MMADDKHSTRRAFLAGAAMVPIAAYAGYRGATSGSVQSGSVRIAPATGGGTTQPAPTGTAGATSAPGPAASASPATVPAATLYARPLHFTFARQNVGATAPIVRTFDGVYTNAQLLTAFQQVPNGITTIMPFFLNVKDLSSFQDIIADVRQAGITIYPAVGGEPSDNLMFDDIYYKNIVDEYAANGFDCIRLENLQGFYDYAPVAGGPSWGRTPIDNMIQYCRTKGFKHIMLNPWPRVKPQQGGQLIEFDYPELDATMYQVLLDFDHDTYVELPNQANPRPNSTNWFAGNQTKIDQVRAYKASLGLPIKILINYEAAPQHKVLYNREITYHDSKTKMNITADQCVASTKDLHWCPPFTTNYDPVALGTWTWVANRLGQMV